MLPPPFPGLLPPRHGSCGHEPPRSFRSHRRQNPPDTGDQRGKPLRARNAGGTASVYIGPCRLQRAARPGEDVMALQIEDYALIGDMRTAALVLAATTMGPG